MKQRVFIGFYSEEIDKRIQYFLQVESIVLSGVLACFNAFNDTGSVHEVHIIDSGRKSLEHIFVG